jgi:hypothetical protein
MIDRPQRLRGDNGQEPTPTETQAIGIAHLAALLDTRFLIFFL